MAPEALPRNRVSTYYVFMTLPWRDVHVLQTANKFKQVTALHVQSIAFPGTASRTPCDRALKRLTAGGYLSRIERRHVGGSRGGSGQFVYQLGAKGFYLMHTGRYSPARAVNYHALAIADSYVNMLQASQAGAFTINGFSTEPDCWAEIAGIQLKPDLFVDITLANTGERRKAWLEVDMGTEGQRQLKGKLESYWRAYNDADVNDWPVFPQVLWVAIDQARANELQWLIEQGPRDAQALFRVTTVAEIGSFASL